MSMLVQSTGEFKADAFIARVWRFGVNAAASVVLMLLSGCEGSWGPWQANGVAGGGPLPFAQCGVAVSGSYAAVCRRDGADTARVIQVFRFNAGAWSLVQVLSDPRAPGVGRFGEVLAMDGARLAVATPKLFSCAAGSLPPGTLTGYVDVYVRDAGVYALEHAFTTQAATTEVGCPELGSIAIDGDTVIAGSRNSQATGRAFVYDLESGAPLTVLSEFTPVRTDGHFGHVVATAGGRLAVSRPGGCLGAGGGNVCGGQVYVYEADGSGGWTEQLITSPALPAAPDPMTSYHDHFGFAMALEASWLAIGDDHPEGGGAFVYIYRRSGTESWTFSQRLTAGSGLGRYSLAANGHALAQADSAGVRTDTGATVGRVRIFRDSARLFGAEGLLVMPTLDYAQRVDVDSRALVISTSAEGVGAVFATRL